MEHPYIGNTWEYPPLPSREVLQPQKWLQAGEKVCCKAKLKKKAQHCFNKSNILPQYTVIYQIILQEELKKTFFSTFLPAKLGIYEKLLTSNNGGDGFFVGDTVCTLLNHYSTFMLLHMCCSLLDSHIHTGRDTCEMGSSQWVSTNDTPDHLVKKLFVHASQAAIFHCCKPEFDKYRISVSTVCIIIIKRKHYRKSSVQPLFTLLSLTHSFYDALQLVNKNHMCTLSMKWPLLSVHKVAEDLQPCTFTNDLLTFFPQLTFVDIVFFTFENSWLAQGKLEVPEPIKSFPKLVAHHKRVMDIPNIKKWLETRPVTPM